MKTFNQQLAEHFRATDICLKKGYKIVGGGIAGQLDADGRLVWGLQLRRKNWKTKIVYCGSLWHARRLK